MSTFWRIEESCGSGQYIILPGLFETREAAERQIAKERSNENMRPALYRRGNWDGPERAEQ